MAHDHAAPADSPTFASFDGAEWDSFSVRRMPNGSWGVLHRRGMPLAASDRPGDVVELLAGFPSRAGACGCAARLARAGYARGAEGDRRRTHVPHLLLTGESVGPVAGDTTGDPSRLGRILVTPRVPAR